MLHRRCLDVKRSEPARCGVRCSAPTLSEPIRPGPADCHRRLRAASTESGPVRWRRGSSDSSWGSPVRVGVRSRSAHRGRRRIRCRRPGKPSDSRGKPAARDCPGGQCRGRSGRRRRSRGNRHYVAVSRVPIHDLARPRNHAAGCDPICRPVLIMARGSLAWPVAEFVRAVPSYVSSDGSQSAGADAEGRSLGDGGKFSIRRASLTTFPCSALRWSALERRATLAWPFPREQQRAASLACCSGFRAEHTTIWFKIRVGEVHLGQTLGRVMASRPPTAPGPAIRLPAGPARWRRG